jgi:HlyD family secretion protein
VAQAAYNLDVAGVSDSSVKNAWSKVVNAEITLEDEQTAPDDDTITAAQLQVSQAEVSLAQAELQLASAEATLADTVLTAPVPGTVTAVGLEVGQRVSAGQAAATLADLSTLVVEIGLDEVDIASVSVGQETIVLLDAFDDVDLRGEITHIAPTAEVQSGVVLYTVEVALDPTDLPARAGMTADVEVVTRSAEDALLVPLKAVRSIGERTFVLRQLREGEEPPAPGAGPGQRGGGQGQPPAGMGVSPGQAAGGDAMGAAFSALQDLLDAGFVPASVELGMITDVYAEITSGLEEGDVVSLATSSTTATESGEPGGPPMPGMGFLGGGGRP